MPKFLREATPEEVNEIEIFLAGDGSLLHQTQKRIEEKAFNCALCGNRYVPFEDEAWIANPTYEWALCGVCFHEFDKQKMLGRIKNTEHIGNVATWIELEKKKKMGMERRVLR